MPCKASRTLTTAVSEELRGLVRSDNFQNSRQTGFKTDRIKEWHHSIYSCCLARIDTDCSLQGLLSGLRLGKGSLDWEVKLVKELAPDVSKSLIKILQLSLVVAAVS